MDPFLSPSGCFLLLFKTIPSFFSCLRECCHTVLVWSSRNVLWNTKLPLNFHQHEVKQIMTEVSLSFKILWLVPNVKPVWGTTVTLLLPVSEGELRTFVLSLMSLFFFFFPQSNCFDSEDMTAIICSQGWDQRGEIITTQPLPATVPPPQRLRVKKVPDFHSFNTPSSTITKCSPPSPRKSGARRKGLIAHRVRYIRTSCHQNPTSVALIRHLSVHPLCRRHCLFLGLVVSSPGSLISTCLIWPC